MNVEDVVAKAVKLATTSTDASVIIVVGDSREMRNVARLLRHLAPIGSRIGPDFIHLPNGAEVLLSIPSNLRRTESGRYFPTVLATERGTAFARATQHG